MSDTRTSRMCEAYRRGAAVKEIAFQFGVQNPAVWKALRRGGVLPPYQPKRAGGGGRPIGGGQAGYSERRLVREVAIIAAREAKEPPRPSQIVARDACFRCGVRGDIGCEHNRSEAPRDPGASSFPGTRLEAGAGGVVNSVHATPISREGKRDHA